MNITFEAFSDASSTAVMDIFNYYATQSFAAYASTALPNAFFNNFLQMTKGYPAYTLKEETTGEVVGFCFLHAYNPFPAFKQTAEISYFMKADATHQGLGHLALAKLEEEARKMGITTIVANISSKNTASLNFHLKQGFKECGRLTQVGQKFDKPFDIVWMQKTL